MLNRQPNKFKFKINREEQYVSFTLTTSFSADDLYWYMKLAADTAKSHKCTNILIDCRNCNFTSNIIEIHYLAKRMNGLGINPKLKSAIVFNQDNEKFQFADTVSHNWPTSCTIRYFNTLEKAKYWLRPQLKRISLHKNPVKNSTA
jgi:S-methylmethionine-dependent homocysteine/selenocysteine methylase